MWSELNIFVRIGAISWWSSLRSLGEISSGPEALFGFKLFKRFSVPLTVIEISGNSFMFLGCVLGTKASVLQELLS